MLLPYYGTDFAAAPTDAIRLPNAQQFVLASTEFLSLSHYAEPFGGAGDDFDGIRTLEST